MTSNGDRVTVAKVGMNTDSTARCTTANLPHCVIAKKKWSSEPSNTKSHSYPSNPALAVRSCCQETHRHDTQTRTYTQVEDVVQQEWFAQVLRAGGFHAVMVLGHMGHDDPLVKVLLAAIREQVMPRRGRVTKTRARTSTVSLLSWFLMSLPCLRIGRRGNANPDGDRPHAHAGPHQTGQQCRRLRGLAPHPLARTKRPPIAPAVLSALGSRGPTTSCHRPPHSARPDTILTQSGSRLLPKRRQQVATSTVLLSTRTQKSWPASWGLMPRNSALR